MTDPRVVAIVQRVAELPDRTSPDDWPEAMLVTSDELAHIVADVLSSSPARAEEGERLKRRKALKLLEAMVEPCEHQQKSGEHEWRKCRRCLAHREAETAHGTLLLAVLLTELRLSALPVRAEAPKLHARCEWCQATIEYFMLSIEGTAWCSICQRWRPVRAEGATTDEQETTKP